MLQETERSPKRRVRREPEEARQLILATAEKLMLEEGYAAITMRRVAKEAALSPALPPYYFPTLDDLLVALYRHSATRDLKLLERALEDADPIKAFWSYQTDTARTALGAEFLALANHRKMIRAEIAEFATHVRRVQAAALARLLPGAMLVDEGLSPQCLATLLTSISRNLNIENAVGISMGHTEIGAWVEQLLTRAAEDQYEE